MATGRYTCSAVCSNRAMLQVVAGVIQRDGRILICRRKREQSHPLQWEFPGGKVEPGETPEQGLARELTEELGMPASAVRNPRLIFYQVQSFAGEPENLVFHEMRWELPARLRELDFVEGDLAFIRGLSAWPS